MLVAAFGCISRPNSSVRALVVLWWTVILEQWKNTQYKLKKIHLKHLAPAEGDSPFFICLLCSRFRTIFSPLFGPGRDVIWDTPTCSELFELNVKQFPYFALTVLPKNLQSGQIEKAKGYLKSTFHLCNFSHQMSMIWSNQRFDDLYLISLSHLGSWKC